MKYFFKCSNLDTHYEKHVISDEDGKWKMPEMTKQEYNNRADKLSSSPAKPLNDTGAKVVGYVTTRRKSVKHDKDTKETVVYVDDKVQGHEAISFYRQSDDKFYRKANEPGGRFEKGSDL